MGEFYHRLKRPDDAKATWAAIISGNNRNTRNLVRFAEVYAGFGYMPEALATMGEACGMDPEFSDRLRFAEMLREEAQLDNALEQIEIAAPMAETPDERQVVLNDRIKCYQASGELPQQIAAACRDELDSGTDATARRWQHPRPVLRGRPQHGTGHGLHSHGTGTRSRFHPGPRRGRPHL